jgi:hypothetical protein
MEERPDSIFEPSGQDSLWPAWNLKLDQWGVAAAFVVRQPTGYSAHLAA